MGWNIDQHELQKLFPCHNVGYTPAICPILSPKNMMNRKPILSHVSSCFQPYFLNGADRTVG